MRGPAPRKTDMRRTIGAKRDSEFVGGKYKELPRPAFYCVQCDLEMQTAEGLAHHHELRHQERL